MLKQSARLVVTSISMTGSAPTCETRSTFVPDIVSAEASFSGFQPMST